MAWMDVYERTYYRTLFGQCAEPAHRCECRDSDEIQHVLRLGIRTKGLTGDCGAVVR